MERMDLGLSHMPCICSQPAKYKCPACTTPYCSVACFKEHKTKCLPEPEPEQKSTEQKSPEQPKPDSGETAAGSKLREDPKLQAMLKYSSLRKHLKLIAEIQNDPSVSREQSAEGRQFVALKKLRELRKGGREQNELVEEFCEYVSGLSQNSS